MLPENLQAFADQINTGISDPETSRALIVFNRTHQSLSGTAVFHAEIAWPAERALPSVVISELGGKAMPSALTDAHQIPDQKGRADKCHLLFALRFAVQDVPAQGWRTYLAAYTDSPGPVLTPAHFEHTSGLIVIETLPHWEELPPVA